jgi:large-conductance mechanosensitive channel
MTAGGGDGAYKKGFYNELRQYVFTHNILAIATGWGIGNATRELIARLIDDVFVPILSSTIGQNKLRAFVTTLQSSSVGSAMYIACSVTFDFLIWIMVILLTFALLEYVLYRGILGLQTKIKPSDIPIFENCQIHSHFHIPEESIAHTDAPTKT